MYIVCKRTMKKFMAFIVCLLAFSVFPGGGQNLALKTNILYDATTTVNAGIEFSLAPKWTMDISANYNGWDFSDNVVTASAPVSKAEITPEEQARIADMMSRLGL